MLEYQDTLRLISSFVIVLFFIYAGFYLLKRYHRKLPIHTGKKLKIEEIQYIGKDKTLVLAKIGRKNYLIAFSSNSIQKIDQWNEKDEKQDSHHEFGTTNSSISRCSRTNTRNLKPVKQP
ncbi:MAG: FliO/MopB family protein [Aquificae bacterium]|nr:FliO/MopB family protein [Aquificota bacterium]